MEDFMLVPQQKKWLLIRLQRGALVTAGVMLFALFSGVAPASAEETNPVTDLERAYAHVVETFMAANPAPVEPPLGVDNATFSAYNHELAAYWRKVPWEAVAGQWACRVRVLGVTVTPNALGYDGAAVGHVLDDSCTTDGSGSLYVKTRNFSEDTEVHASAWDDSCGYLSGPFVNVCLGRGNGMVVEFTWQYTGWVGTYSGRSRLGYVGLGNLCSSGSFLHESVPITLGPGQRSTYQYAVNQNTQWSNEFYETPYLFKGRHCAVI
jgi:hypothetical protein